MFWDLSHGLKFTDLLFIFYREEEERVVYNLVNVTICIQNVYMMLFLITNCQNF